MADDSTNAKQKRLDLYVTAFCGYCRAAERLLEERTIPFATHSVEDPSVRAEVAERTGWRTVPVVLLDGELVGGYSELRALDASGELVRRLERGCPEAGG